MMAASFPVTYACHVLSGAWYTVKAQAGLPQFVPFHDKDVLGETGKSLRDALVQSWSNESMCVQSVLVTKWRPPTVTTRGSAKSKAVSGHSGHPSALVSTAPTAASIAASGSTLSDAIALRGACQRQESILDFRGGSLLAGCPAGTAGRLPGQPDVGSQQQKFAGVDAP